ncbi:MAG: VWA domain-containing protein [Chloroflexi bacterium]|nr:VWA domain-containing protein [Chloroflexota bacterium]
MKNSKPIYRHVFNLLCILALALLCSSPSMSALAGTTSSLTAQAGEEGICGPIDLVLAVDVSGSMVLTIETVKKEIAAVLDDVNLLSGGDYQLGLVTFVDDLQVAVDLAPNNRNKVEQRVAGLRVGGGSNFPEASDAALDTIIHRRRVADRQPGQQTGDFNGTFRPRAAKMIILVTDALPGGFHDNFTPGVDDVHAHQMALDAKAADIRISAIQISDFESVRVVMLDYATTSGGIFQQSVEGREAGIAVRAAIHQCTRQITDLAIQKAVSPAVAAPGAPITYTLTYSNTSPNNIAKDVVISDSVPVTITNLSFVASSAALPGWAVTARPGTTFTWDVGDLPPLAVGVITITGFVGAGLLDPTFITNTATITSPTMVDRIPGNNSAEASLQVILDTYEPNDDWKQATVITATQVYTSYISRPIDVDWYKFPVPPRGSKVTVSLTHMAADFDLALFGPTEVSSDVPLSDLPLTNIPLKDIPLKDIPLKDIPLKDVSLANMPLTDIPLKDIPLKDIPLKDISVHRNLVDEQASDISLYTTGYYYVEVFGHQGTSSTTPYALQVDIQPPDAIRSCSRTLPGPGTAGAVYQPFSNPDTQTLILMNKQRLDQLYDSGAANALVTKLQEFAQHPTVKGMILPVETDSGVAAAYAAWDQNTCDPEAANQVAGAIKNLVSANLSALSRLVYIVIVGSDEVVPFRRIQDLVQTSNERDYRDLARVKPDSALAAGLDGGFILTDDFYADFEPTNYAGRPLYVANYPIGRLVETPAEIAGQLTYYLASNGVLTATTSLEVGYDFLKQGAQIISQTLTAKGLNNTAMINDTWTAQDLADTFLDSRHDINSINAHFQHWRIEPASRAAGLLQSDRVAQSHVLTGTVIFSVGCHSGLNVCDLVSTGPPASQDFAQVFAQKQAVYVANTGYGYGDTEAPALSVQLMDYFASNLGGGATRSVGEALINAKHEYALLNIGSYGLYSEKALIEATLYGLPMYQVILPTSASGPTLTRKDPLRLVAPAAQVESSDPSTRDTLLSQTGIITRSFTVSPTLTPVHTPDGTYYTSFAGAETSLYQPVQPRTSLDISLPATIGREAVAHGALFKTAIYTDILNFDPVITMPVTDTNRYEPQWIYSGWVPQTLGRITHFQNPQGVEERLVLTPGQFFHTRVVNSQVVGTERLYNHLTYEVIYSNAEDFTPPTIESIGSLEMGNNLQLGVGVHDLSGVMRVLVTYTDGHGAWKFMDLAYDQGLDLWTGSLKGLTGNIAMIFQAVDGAGNVGTSHDKGNYYLEHISPNVLPLVTIDAIVSGTPGFILAGQIATLTTSFRDPDALDTHTATVDWGDGTQTAGVVSPAPGSGTVTGSHAYLHPGTYQVTVTVADNHGASGTATRQLVVVQGMRLYFPILLTYR